MSLEEAQKHLQDLTSGLKQMQQDYKELREDIIEDQNEALEITNDILRTTPKFDNETQLTVGAYSEYQTISNEEAAKLQKDIE